MAQVNELTCSYQGKEYVFLAKDQEQIDDLMCPVCIEVVFEPVLTPCGHLFCQNCLTDVRECPSCRNRLFRSVRDRRTERKVKNLKVKCLHQKLGCTWVGELGYVMQHLTDDCQFAEIACTLKCGSLVKRKHMKHHWKTDCQCAEIACTLKCGSMVKRKYLDRHVREECRQRPFICIHCGQKDTFELITDSHYTYCAKFSLKCPGGCGDAIARDKMKVHLEVCPEELIPCAYPMLQCTVKQKNMESHNEESKDSHLALALEAMTELNRKYCQLYSALTSPKVRLPLSPYEIEQPFCPWLQNTPTCYPRPPWVVKLEGFEEKKRNDEVWYSNPVYSHFGGYKMCLRVSPNGVGIGKGTHISVYIFLMKGDNDNNLKFPFKGRIVVSLLNQLEDQNHHTREPWSPESNVPEDVSARVTTGERHKGWGYPQFIHHENLNLTNKNRQYLKNNHLFFRVDKFIFKQVSN